MQISIRAKLYILVGIAVAALAIVTVAGSFSVGEIASTNRHLLVDSKRSVTQMTTDMMHDAIRGDVLMGVVATTNEERAHAAENLATHARTLTESLGSTRRQAIPGSALAVAVDVAAASVDLYLASARQVLASTSFPELTRTQLVTFTGLFARLEVELERVTDQLQADAATTATEGVETAMRYLIVAAIAAALLLVALGMWTGRSISRRLARVASALTAVADRDLSKRIEVDQNDEIGEMCASINRALDSVDAAFGDITLIARDIADASTALASSSDTISAGAQQQAASLEETAASLEEIATTVTQSAESARSASRLATSSSDSARLGGQIVEQVRRAMDDVMAASKQVGAIVTTIDEIAMQTNLLSLNAAVEAARAAEHGRGFAVVASGVGDLARRSATAAKQVKGLIETTLERIAASSLQVDRSSAALEDIISSTAQVNELFGEIAAAASEQSSGVTQVSQAMTQMDQVTQSSSIQTSELSTMAEQLASQAARMREMLGHFKLASTTTVAAVPAKRLATGSSSELDRFAMGLRWHVPATKRTDASPSTSTETL